MSKVPELRRAMSIHSNTSFQVGDWRVEPQANRLSKGGDVVTIEPRVMELLVYLARHAGEVVSSEDIFREVWPNVVVGDNSLYRGIAQIRKVLGDNTTEPRFIATVPKRGYRLIAKVTTGADESAALSESRFEATTTANGSTRPGRMIAARTLRNWILAGVLLAILLAVGMWWLHPSDLAQDAGPNTPAALTTIAVLPFTNVSNDPGNDYFALGLSDELLNTLSQAPELAVVARTSSYSIQDFGDIREIATRFNVGNIIEGSVRKAGNTVRVNVQLVDATSGFDIWSGEYKRELDDVFAIQEEIALSVLQALSQKLDIALNLPDSQPKTAEIEAFELYLLGRHYLRRRDPTELERAVALFKHANHLDRDYAPAYSGLAEAYLLQTEYGDLDRDEALALADAAIDEALELDDSLSEAHATRGLARFYASRYDEAETELHTAIDLNRSNASAYMWLALTLAYHEGKIEESQRYYERAMRLDPLNETLALNITYNLSRLGRYGEALEGLEEASGLHPNSLRIQLGIAQVAVEHGRLDIAHGAAHKALELRPDSARAMTMLAYTAAILGDLTAAEYWIERTEATGGRTSQWFLGMARAAVYLQKGDFAAMVALVDLQTGQQFRPDPLLFFASREWQPIGMAGAGQMLMGNYPMAADKLELCLQQIGDARVTQGSEDGPFYLENLAYVRDKMGAQEAFQRAIGDAERIIAEARENGWRTNLIQFHEARAHALRGQTETSMELLQEALDQGLTSFWWLEQDPVFYALRENATFKRLKVRERERLDEMLQRIRSQEPPAQHPP